MHILAQSILLFFRNMDADLFMECEEEELEPWQQQPSMDELVGNAESNTYTSETNMGV